jgi:flagellum-specific peptidoglycan hydrolase FlgJ
MNNPRLPLIASLSVGCEKTTGFPASVSVAQCALESDWLNKATYNNCFGLKARKGFPCFNVETHEFVACHEQEEDLFFEAFPSLAACFERHARLIIEAPIYASAWALYLHTKSASLFVPAMARHYATSWNDPKAPYATIVLRIMNQSDVVAAIEEARKVV